MSKKKVEIKSTVWKDKSGQTHSRVRVLEDGKEVSSYISTGPDAETAVEQAFGEMRQGEEDRPGIEHASVEFERPPAGGKPPKPVKPPSARDTDGDGIPDEIDRVVGASPEIKVKGRNHTPWQKGFDGKLGTLLKEEVPTYLKRPGDRVITAASDKAGGYNNNAAIILGRDRSSIGERWAPWRNIQDLASGYSDHQAAGAIDIVVGRMSPFPVKSFLLAGKDVPLRLAPIFKTKHNENLSTSVSLIDSASNTEMAHPGLGMDAARIYLSQMTEVDKNFGFTMLKRDFPVSAAGNENIDEKMRALNGKYVVPDDEPGIPTSAIAAVADKVRLYARQDIKIMTGGIDYQGTDPQKLEQYNSQGNKIGTFSGIHLIAGNGSSESQQPIPKGNDLVKAFGELVSMVDNLIGVVDGLTQAQMEYNGVLMNHFHNSPLNGMPTTPSLPVQVFGVKTMADHIARVKLGVVFLKSNIVRFKLNHLNVSGDGYICSRYNTTN